MEYDLKDKAMEVFANDCQDLKIKCLHSAIIVSAGSGVTAQCSSACGLLVLQCPSRSHYSTAVDRFSLCQTLYLGAKIYYQLQRG